MELALGHDSLAPSSFAWINYLFRITAVWSLVIGELIPYFTRIFTMFLLLFLLPGPTRDFHRLYQPVLMHELINFDGKPCGERLE